MRLLKRILFFSLFLVLLYGGRTILASNNQREAWQSKNNSEDIKVTLRDDGIVFPMVTKSIKVGDFLRTNNVELKKDDFVSPSLDTLLLPGMNIIINRAKHITLHIDKKQLSITTYQTEIGRVFLENGIIVDEDDMILPQDAPVTDSAEVSLVKVTVTQKKVKKPIPFKEVIEENGELSWRKTIINQKGEDGIEELTYEIVTHNGSEMATKLVQSMVIQEPKTQRVAQGTKIELGKMHTGLGSWYAYTGTMSAASPWLPKGSSVKVTNQNNGKTVIVKINDRGPFGKNRILDLDKVAFSEIASVGAGIIPITVEEILN